MNVEFVIAAEQELDDAISYFEQQRSGLGLVFAMEVASAVARISAYPHVCKACPVGRAVVS